MLQRLNDWALYSAWSLSVVTERSRSGAEVEPKCSLNHWDWKEMRDSRVILGG